MQDSLTPTTFPLTECCSLTKTVKVLGQCTSLQGNPDLMPGVAHIRVSYMIRSGRDRGLSGWERDCPQGLVPNHAAPMPTSEDDIDMVTLPGWSPNPSPCEESR